MFRTIEQGSTCEIKQANFNRLVAIARPFVSKSGFAKSWTEVKGIINNDGQALKNLKLFIAADVSEGGIFLHNASNGGKEPHFENIISRFRYSVYDRSNSSDIFLQREVLTRQFNSLGLGTALVYLGDLFIANKAQDIARAKKAARVWSYSQDTSYLVNNPRRGFRWTTSILNDLGYTHSNQIFDSHLEPLLNDYRSGVLVKQLI